MNIKKTLFDELEVNECFGGRGRVELVPIF